MLNIYYSTNVKRPIKVDGKVIGWLDNNTTFYKSVIGSKHRLRTPPAWAIDAEVFDTQIKPKAKWIVIKDKETSIEYQTSVATFDQFKRVLDRGFGRQYYLKLNYWLKYREGNNA